MGRWVLLYACLVVSLRASDTPHWLKITSPNFELYTTANDRAGREVARHFEQVSSFFRDAMGLGLKSGPPVRIVVFRSDKEYAPYAPNEYAAAFYLGTDLSDYIVIKSPAADQFHTAVHEYTHLLLRHSGFSVPVWFNEGLAEFYSNLKPSGSKVEVGGVIAPHYLLLRKSKWIDLHDLLEVTSVSPLYNVRSHAGLFYAESWSLVHMLYLGKEYRPRLPALLEGIKNGANMEATFRKAYGKSVEQVQHDLSVYINSGRFDEVLFNVKLAAAVDKPDVAEANPIDARLMLADILANTEAKADGRKLYGELAREVPNDWRIEAGLARLSRREWNDQDAMMHYARAAKLGSDEARLYLEYGRLLRLHDKDAEAVEILRRAVELNPEYTEARVELGLACVVSEQFEEALEQFWLVKQVAPQQAFGYYHAMAYAYYRTGQKAEARAAAAASRKFAKTREQVDRLDQLAAALDYAELRGAAPEPERLPSVDGTLTQVDCSGEKIRIRVTSGERSIWFNVDPNAVAVKTEGSTDFTCGPQQPRRIRVEYSPGGTVKTIEFPQ